MSRDTRRPMERFFPSRVIKSFPSTKILRFDKFFEIAESDFRFAFSREIATASFSFYMYSKLNVLDFKEKKQYQLRNYVI